MGLFAWQSGELAENVSKIIDSPFADKVDMSEVQVLNFTNYGHAALCLILFLRFYWKTCDFVG